MPSEEALEERVQAGRLQLWLLLDGNRWLVAGLLLAAIFLVLTALVVVDPVPLERAIDSTDLVSTLFQALVTGIVTGVTLVVTINQLVLSQELGAAGDQRQRMEGSLQFREDVADHLDVAVSPVDPPAFLASILEAASDRARELRSAAQSADARPPVDASADDESVEELLAYAEEVVENAVHVRERLDGTDFGTFAVTRAALDFEYASKIYDGKVLQARWCPEGDDATDRDARTGDVCRTLDELVTVLQQYGPAREHVKTLYFQWTLVELSRGMLYTSVPALAIAIGTLLTVGDGESVPGATLGVANEAWVVLLAATLALAPFALLLSYVLRIGTVAQRTLAIGPFLLRSTGDSGDDDGD